MTLRAAWIMVGVLGLGVASMVASPGCRRDASNPPVIDRPGRYIMENGALIINVVVNDRGLVAYSARDERGNLLLASTHPFAASQRWHMYWDKQHRLWVHSSDTGDLVWRRGKGGGYTSVSIGAYPTWIRSMPGPFYDRMPNTLKKRWDAIRR